MKMEFIHLVVYMGERNFDLMSDVCIVVLLTVKYSRFIVFSKIEQAVYAFKRNSVSMTQ